MFCNIHKSNVCALLIQLITTYSCLETSASQIVFFKLGDCHCVLIYWLLHWCTYCKQRGSHKSFLKIIYILKKFYMKLTKAECGWKRLFEIFISHFFGFHPLKVCGTFFVHRDLVDTLAISFLSFLQSSFYFHSYLYL